MHRILFGCILIAMLVVAGSIAVPIVLLIIATESVHAVLREEYGYSAW
jgi:hypothetical protein